MDEGQQNYFVYIHINKINHKKYIGITCQKPTRRWGKNGGGYKDHHPHFYNAIQKYGWDNFEHVIYQTGLTKEQACGLEQQLILLFETRNPDKGYNISGGGESGAYIDGRTSNPDYTKKYRREYSKRPEPHEKKKARDRKYAQRNADKIKEYGKEYRRKNETKIKEYMKEYRKEMIQNETPEHKEKRMKQQKEGAQKRREKRKLIETAEEKKKRLIVERKYKRRYAMKKKYGWTNEEFEIYWTTGEYDGHKRKIGG